MHSPARRPPLHRAGHPFDTCKVMMQVRMGGAWGRACAWASSLAVGLLSVLGSCRPCVESSIRSLLRRAAGQPWAVSRGRRAAGGGGPGSAGHVQRHAGERGQWREWPAACLFGQQMRQAAAVSQQDGAPLLARSPSCPPTPHWRRRRWPLWPDSTRFCSARAAPRSVCCRPTVRCLLWSTGLHCLAAGSGVYDSWACRRSSDMVPPRPG